MVNRLGTTVDGDLILMPRAFAFSIMQSRPNALTSTPSFAAAAAMARFCSSVTRTWIWAPFLSAGFFFGRVMYRLGRYATRGRRSNFLVVM